MRIRTYIFSLLLITLFFSGINAQTDKVMPDLTVAEFELGNRQKAKDFFAKGYSPRQGEDGRPEYYFYNEFGTQVMKVVGESTDDPNFITEIEVFAVGESYQNKHFYLKDTGYFVTDSGIFIGYRQSVASMILFPGVTRRDIIGPKDVLKIKGEPDEKFTNEKKRDVFVYKLPNVKIDGEPGVYNYEARYEFYKKQVKKFSLKIVPAKEMKL
jgi:hypothetical protein